jgi:hypothetical protein
MNYWMFTVMYDEVPNHWPTLISTGLAAQHYPQGWTNEKRNLNLLKQMEKGDAVVAGLKKRRFAGYGYLTSGFYRGGKSLAVKKGKKCYEFQERADIDWTVISPKVIKPYVECKALKKRGYNVEMTRGLCIKKISRQTFNNLRKILDKAGAEKVIYGQTGWKLGRASDQKMDALEDQEPVGVNKPVKKPSNAQVYERDPEVRNYVIRRSKGRCEYCGAESFIKNDNKYYIETHHIIALAADGKDTVRNVIALCPNHHREAHYGRNGKKA